MYEQLKNIAASHDKFLYRRIPSNSQQNSKYFILSFIRVTVTRIQNETTHFPLEFGVIPCPLL